MHNSGYRAILFDLDDTLLQERVAARQGLRNWTQQHGHPHRPEHWQQVEQHWFSQYEQGLTTHVGQRIGRIRDYFEQPTLPEDAALKHIEVFYQHYIAASTVFPDAVEALDLARRYAETHDGVVGIFSNGASALQVPKMQAAGIWDENLRMFTAKELGAPKPQPQSYALVAEALGLRPQEILMIGDNPTNDVSAARDAGWHALLLDRSAPGPAPGTITELTQLSAILQATPVE